MKTTCGCTLHGSCDELKVLRSQIKVLMQGATSIRRAPKNNLPEIERLTGICIQHVKRVRTEIDKALPYEPPQPRERSYERRKKRARYRKWLESE